MGCFHLGDVMTDVAMNLGAHACVWTHISSFLGYTRGWGCVSHGNSVLNGLETRQTVSMVAAPFTCPSPAVNKGTAPPRARLR